MRDEPDTSGQRFDVARALITIIPSGIWREEIAGDEGVEVRRDSYRLRGDRGALVSHAISLQHVVVEERATGTYHGIDCFEPVHLRANNVQHAISTMLSWIFLDAERSLLHRYIWVNSRVGKCVSNRL